MADQNKTLANEGDVDAFVAGIEDDQRRAEAQTLLTLMSEVTGAAPTMWGSSIVGFGHQHRNGADRAPRRCPTTRAA